MFNNPNGKIIAPSGGCTDFAKMTARNVGKYLLPCPYCGSSEIVICPPYYCDVGNLFYTNIICVKCHHDESFPYHFGFCSNTTIPLINDLVIKQIVEYMNLKTIEYLLETSFERAFRGNM